MLDLRNNPLPEPYQQLIERGTAAVLTYLRSLSQSLPQYEAKLLLVGEGNVGKTSLVEAMRAKPEQRRKAFVKNRDTTHGIHLGRLDLTHPESNDNKITLNTWDFGGQEVYRITHQFFFSKRSLYLLVWRPRDGREAGEIEDWLRRIRLRVPDARVILVSTHADERRHGELDYPDLDRRFPRMLAGSYQVDNQSGMGVDDLLAAIAQEAAKLPQMGERLNPRWIESRDKVLALKRPQISRHEFDAIAGECGLAKDEAKVLLELLHDIGRIVYYDDEGLRDFVVIQPEWLTKAIGYVLEDSETRKANGELPHARLRKIWFEHGEENWDRYDPKSHPFFLRLMEKFDISYRAPQEKMSLVAQLVPFERPALPWDLTSELDANSRELSVRCAMAEKSPDGLVAWLTVRNHRFARECPGLHWRKGVFLKHHGQGGLIELRNPETLAITVRVPSPGHFFSLLRDSLEYLIEQRWPGLQYELRVPCRGSLNDGRACTNHFLFEDLLGLREDDIPDIRCPRCRKNQDVGALLTGFETPISLVDQRLDEILNAVGRVETGVGRVEDAIDRQRNEAAQHLRVVLKALNAENRDCPRLFLLVPTGWGAVRNKYELTIWCEHPGREHPCAGAVYTIQETKEWVSKLAPYMKLAGKMLRVVVARGWSSRRRGYPRCGAGFE